MAPHLFSKITIIGVGLIGGSFALGCRSRGLAAHVVGAGRHESSLSKAKALGAIDSHTTDFSSAAMGADLVMLATPISAMAALAEQIKGVLKAGAIVTDVGSAKKKVVEQMEEILGGRAFFVGGHPVAGKETQGVEEADPGIFLGARCILTVSEKTDAGALEKVSELWRKLGCEVVYMSPGEHDSILAAVSHLPQLAASCLIDAVYELGGKDQRLFRYAGRGLADSTRIAASNPEMWTDICLLNKGPIAEALSKYKKSIDRAAQLIESGDSQGLQDFFRLTRHLRINMKKTT